VHKKILEIIDKIVSVDSVYAVPIEMLSAVQIELGKDKWPTQLIPAQVSDIESEIKTIRAKYKQKLENDSNTYMFQGFSGTFLQLKETITLDEDKSEDVLYFYSNFQLSIMQQCSTIFIDGNFKIHPKKYGKSQLLILGGLYSDRFVPCCFILHKSRKINVYCLILQHFISKQGFKNTKIIVSDFERALLKSISKALPAVRHLGCFFHLKKNLFKRLKKISLEREQKRQILADFSINIFIGKEDEVKSRVDIIIKKWVEKFNENAALKSKLESFSKYYMKPSILQLICYTKKDTVFTNNFLEAYNNRVQVKNKAQMPFTSFIKFLKKEELYFKVLIYNELFISATGKSEKPYKETFKTEIEIEIEEMKSILEINEKKENSDSQMISCSEEESSDEEDSEESDNE